MDGPVRAVLFDAVGTLFRPRGTVGDVYCHVAASHGLTVDSDLVNERFIRETGARGTPTDQAGWKALVRAVFEGLGVFTDFDAFFEDVYAAFRSDSGWCCYPETVPVLEELERAGYILGVVSNFDDRLHGVLEALGLARFFATVATPESTGFAKPAPGIYLAATRDVSVDPSRTLFVGDDRQQDYEGASRAGLRAVLITRAGHLGGAQDEIRDLSELLPILQVK
jgi:putative hydrolase of the HAD superfamily